MSATEMTFNSVSCWLDDAVFQDLGIVIYIWEDFLLPNNSILIQE